MIICEKVTVENHSYIVEYDDVLDIGFKKNAIRWLYDYKIESYEKTGHEKVISWNDLLDIVNGPPRFRQDFLNKRKVDVDKN